MSIRFALALSLLAVSPALAAPVALSPVTTGTAGGRYLSDTVPSEGPACLGQRPLERSGIWPLIPDISVAEDEIGWIYENRAIYEFDLSAIGANFTATLSFNNRLATDTCIVAFRGDGEITIADFQPVDRSPLFVAPGNPGVEDPDPPRLSFDLTPALRAFLGDVNGTIFALQFAMASQTDIEYIPGDIRLEIEAISVPEPAAFGLLGLGFTVLAGSRTYRQRLGALGLRSEGHRHARA